jgi:hypothetical protein
MCYLMQAGFACIKKIYCEAGYSGTRLEFVRPSATTTWELSLCPKGKRRDCQKAKEIEESCPIAVPSWR